MSDAFLDRLKNKQLTNIDQYRRMQQTLSEVKSEDRSTSDDTEVWRQWQLVPVTSDHNDVDDPTMVDPRSQGAQGLYRAVRQLSEK